MRVEICGDRGRGPLLVFLPGMDGTGELLLETAGRLEERFRLIRMRYVDEGLEPGAGLYVRLAEAAAQIIRATGAGPALVLAESFGGGVALQLALDASETVRGLALVNTFARFPRPGRARLGARLIPWTPAWAVRRGRDLVGARLFFRPRRNPVVEGEFMRHAVGFEHPGFAARLGSIPCLDLVPRLGDVGVPAALYASTHDRVLPSGRTMAEIAARLPNATLESIERANHIVLPLPEEPWVERLEVLLDRAGGRD